MLPLLSLSIVAVAPPLHLRLVQGSRLEPGAREVSDAELVHLVQSGQRHPFQELYNRHVDRVLLRAGRLLRSKYEAQDVVQDAFLEALRDLSKLREPQRFGAWLDRIVMHQVHRRFRKRRALSMLGLSSILGQRTGSLQTQEQPTSLDQFAHVSVSPDHLAQLRQLDVLLRQVSDSERSAWMLRRLDELALAEIAVQCDCSLATAKRRIAKVDQLLSRHFSFVQSEEDKP
ncbi:MAG TPA: RNA polymerase sigma factor [Polyangiaceae bacterium]|nr:RNA polymerase sigma factor [Polyangiaceae bacterium]